MMDASPNVLMSKPICPWASIIRLTTILAVVSGSGSVMAGYDPFSDAVKSRRVFQIVDGALQGVGVIPEVP
jgi:hypothetical protein